MPDIVNFQREYNFYDLCPIPEKKPKIREKYKHDENETPSFKDPVFGDLREKQQLTNSDYAIVSNIDKSIEVSKDAIETHIDRRIASFFEQLIVCYKVPYHFEIGETMHQAESTLTLQKKIGNTTRKVLFASAHCSTIPCLYAYDRSKREKWLSDGQPQQEKPKGFVYLQDSDTYRLHNSTMGLIQVINQADNAIDGTKNDDNKLRTFAINIINGVAKGVITPMQGVERFVDEGRVIVENQLGNNRCQEQIKKVLRIYNESFVAIKNQIQNPTFFDYLLNVKSPHGRESITQVIYAMRFKIIRECHEVQSAIFQKIKKLSAEIKGKTTPSYFNKAFKRVLLERISYANRKSLEKLFNLSLDDLKGLVPNKEIATFRKIETKENLQKIDLLLKDIWQDFWNLRRKELYFRKDLFYKLRHTYGMSQRDLAWKYKQLFPYKPMSQSGISRIENTIKWIDHPLALDMARVYGLDPGVFLPFLFTSLYE